MSTIRASRRHNRLAAIFAAPIAVVACLVVPAAAHCNVIGADGAFTLQGSHGYSITVMAYSRRADGQGQVMVFVEKKGASVTYIAAAKVTNEGIEASLGSVGRIAVTFVASGSIAEERSDCGGRGNFIQFDAGTYQGMIEFHGEEAYTEASATQVAVELEPFLDLICAGRGWGESIGSGLPGARLKVWSVSQRHPLVAQFNENHPGARMTFEAHMSERHAGIAISRRVEGVVPGRAFEFADGLRTARLGPPAPFSGIARFHRGAAQAARWAGSLALDFPGRSNVPLTGLGFKVTLVPARRTSS